MQWKRKHRDMDQHLTTCGCSKVISTKVIHTALIVLIVAQMSHPELIDNSRDSSLFQVSEEQMKSYLMRFHYVPHPSHDTSDPSLPEELLETEEETVFSQGLKNFQKTWGLQETGILDEETRYLMSLPRCGVPDDDITTVRLRVRRYTYFGDRWPGNTLYWHAKYHPLASITEDEFHEQVERAFELWASVTPLNFIETATKEDANITLSFERGYHGDASPFDGPRGVLGHAFPPPDGRLHFDVDERFVVKRVTDKTTDFYFVAAHELGHSLGLGHSWVYSSLMAPFYRGLNPDFALHQDDINAIQSRYGSGKGTVKSLRKKLKWHLKQRPDKIDDSKNQNYVNRFDSNTAKKNKPQNRPRFYPWWTTRSTTTPRPTTTTTTTTTTPRPTTRRRPTTRHWPRYRPNGRRHNRRRTTTAPTTATAVTTPPSRTVATPTPRFEYDRDSNRVPTGGWNYCRDARVDTVVQHMQNGKLDVYVFHEDEILKLNGASFQVANGYPRRISEVFPGLPNDIDAALYYGPEKTIRYPWPLIRANVPLTLRRNGPRTYFFKGKFFWEYRDGMMQPGYPKKISHVWKGVPNNIDAVFTWSGNDKIYFVKDTHYYRFNPDIGKVDSGYPRYLAGVWESIPVPPDAAIKVTSEGDTVHERSKIFFFQGPYYYRYTDKSLLIDPGYPKLIKRNWFSCPGMLSGDEW